MTYADNLGSCGESASVTCYVFTVAPCVHYTGNTLYLWVIWIHGIQCF